MKKRFLSILAFCFMLVPTLFALSACGENKKASFTVNVNVKNSLVYSVNGSSSATDDFSFSVKEYEGDTYTFSVNYKGNGYDLANVKVAERSGKSFTKRAGGQNYENTLYIEITPQDGESYNFTIGDPQEKVALMPIMGLDDATLSTVTSGTPAYSLLLSTQIYATRIVNGAPKSEYINIVKEVKGETESYLVSNVANAFVPAGRMQERVFVLASFDNGSERVVYNFSDLEGFIKVQNSSSKLDLDFESEYDLIPYLNESGYYYFCQTSLVSESASIYIDIASVKDIQFKKNSISTNIYAVTCANSEQSNKMTYEYVFKVEKVNGVDVGDASYIEKEYGKKLTLMVAFDSVNVEVDPMSSNYNEQVALVPQLKEALKQITNFDSVKFLLNGKAFGATGEKLVASYDSSSKKWTLEIGEDVTPFDVTGSNTISFYLSADNTSFKTVSSVLVSNVNYSKEFVYPLSVARQSAYTRYDEGNNEVQNVPFKHIVDNAGNKFDTYLTTFASDGTNKTISSQVVALDMYMSDFDLFTLKIDLGNNNIYTKSFESGKDYDLFTTPVDGAFEGVKMFKRGQSFDDASWAYLLGDASSERFVRYKVFAYDNNGAYLQYGNFMRVEIKQGNGNEMNVNASIFGENNKDAQKRAVTFASENGVTAKFFNNSNGDEGQTISLTAGEQFEVTLTPSEVYETTPDIVFDFYCGNKLIFTADRGSQEYSGTVSGDSVYKFGTSNITGYSVNEIYCRKGYSLWGGSENSFKYQVDFSGFMVKMVQIARDKDEVSQSSEADPTYVLCDRVVVRIV